MKHLLLASAAAFALGAPMAASAADAAAAADAQAQDLGPAVGTTPAAVTAIDATGAERTFADLTGDNGLVLVFVRSADWCPFCKKQLEDMNSVNADLEAAGYTLAALSYDTTDKLAAFAEQASIDFTLLSDEDSSVIRDYGVLNEEFEPGSRVYGIPHPIVVVLSAEGVVEAKLYEEGYRERPAGTVVLETVTGLSAS